MNTIFQQVNEHFDQEQNRRDKINDEFKKLDVQLRNLQAHLTAIHNSNSNCLIYFYYTNTINILQFLVKEICDKAKPMFQEMHSTFVVVDKLISKETYFKYYNTWNFRLTQICFLAALYHWILMDLQQPSSDNLLSYLITKDQVQELVGLNQDDISSFFIPLEDYLMGVCNFCTEVSRFAVNAVTKQDYEAPQRIGKFLNELYSGFRMLNLKNDNLRKRFDGIKYDIKRVEDILYDLSIRNLLSHQKQ